MHAPFTMVSCLRTPGRHNLIDKMLSPRILISVELVLNCVAVDDRRGEEGARNVIRDNHSNGSVIEIKPVEWELKCSVPRKAKVPPPTPF